MKMPQEIKTKWLAALRSGEYNQGTGSLREPGTQYYCCLGVLQMVCDGKVEDGLPMPSREWFESHKIIAPYHDTSVYELAEMNDGQEGYCEAHTFEEIADVIERDVEGVPSE